MAYTRAYPVWKDWPDKTTPLTAAKLQGIEDGINAAVNYDPRAGWVGTTLARTFTAAYESLGIAVLSDSTANDPTDWFYLWGAAVVARHPSHTVRFYQWSDTTQDYGAPLVIQTGTLGDRYINFTGASFNWALPSTAVTTPPTDLDVSVLVSLDDWTPAAQQRIGGHSGGAGVRGWWLQIETNGRVSLVWSNDGTALITVTSSVAPVVLDGAQLWVRAQLDVDDGAGHYTVKFFTSPASDGATWTQLGTTTTGGTTTTLFNPPSTNYTIGGATGTSVSLAGKMYEVRIRSGLAGGTILPVFVESWLPYSSGSPNLSGASGAPVLALLGGAQSGQGLTYLSNATRLPLLLPDYSLRAVLMAISHNDGSTLLSIPAYDDGYLTAWSAWITAVKARSVEAVPIMMTQNPEVTGSSSTTYGIRSHRLRRDRLLALASTLAMPAIDAWQAFLDSNGVVQSSLINPDGVHPTTTGAGDGMHLWASHVDTALASP